jgi:hypothetical protein
MPMSSILFDKLFNIANHFEKFAIFEDEEDPRDVEDIIADSAAEIMWLHAWANDEERHGRTHSQMRIEDIAPRVPDKFYVAGRDLIKTVEMANGGISINRLFEDAASKEGKHYDEPTPENFGKDIDRKAMGVGSWNENHPDIDLKVPSIDVDFIFEGSADKYLEELLPEGEESKENIEEEEDLDFVTASAKKDKHTNFIFPKSHPKVKDKKDHFPIPNANHARNALSRAGAFDKAPTWFSGSLSEFKNSIRRAVKAKYKGIEVSDKKKKADISLQNSIVKNSFEDKCYILGPEGEIKQVPYEEAKTWKQQHVPIAYTDLSTDTHTIYVSTVFSSRPFDFDFDSGTEQSEPELFETMASIDNDMPGRYQKRYKSYNAAMQGHEEIVKQVKDDIGKEDFFPSSAYPEGQNSPPPEHDDFNFAVASFNNILNK